MHKIDEKYSIFSHFLLILGLQVLPKGQQMLLFWKVQCICDRFALSLALISPKLMKVRSLEFERSFWRSCISENSFLCYFPYCFGTLIFSKIHFFNPICFVRRFSSSSSNDFIQSAFCIQMRQTFRIFHLPRASTRARARNMPSLQPIWAKNAVFYLFWHSSASFRVNRCCLKGQHVLTRINFIISAFKRTLNRIHTANTAKVSSTQNPSKIDECRICIGKKRGPKC